MTIKPYKFTAQRKAEFLKHLSEGMRRGAAIQAVGLTRYTLMAHIRDDPDFEAAMHLAEMDANEQVEDSLFQAGLAGNVTACQVWLYNRAPDRWKDRRNVQHSGPDGGPIEIALDARELLLARIHNIIEQRGSDEAGREPDAD